MDHVRTPVWSARLNWTALELHCSRPNAVVVFCSDPLSRNLTFMTFRIWFSPQQLCDTSYLKIASFISLSTVLKIIICTCPVGFLRPILGRNLLCYEPSNIWLADSLCTSLVLLWRSCSYWSYLARTVKSTCNDNWQFSRSSWCYCVIDSLVRVFIKEIFFFLFFNSKQMLMSLLFAFALF